jgi:hypothetical protein
MPTRRRPNRWYALDTEDGRTRPPADRIDAYGSAYNPTRPVTPPGPPMGRDWPIAINPD